MTRRRPHYHHVVLVAALLLTGLLLLTSACGGTEETTTTVAETMTTAGAGAAGGGTSGHVSVEGLVDNPTVITSAELEKMTVAEITVDHPKLGMTDYRGVRLSELFEVLGVQSGAATLTMTAADGYMAEVPLADIAASADALLAIGEGGALSVVIPGMESKSWVKDVVSFEFK